MGEIRISVANALVTIAGFATALGLAFLSANLSALVGTGLTIAGMVMAAIGCVLQLTLPEPDDGDAR